jgi:metal-responsive CopG/Arc/MetJ family transcriptional regulator
MKARKKRLDGGKKLVSLTASLERDMKSFCREKGIESESELVRQAIAKYIAGDYSDETFRLAAMSEALKKIAELKDMIDILFRYLRLMHINTLTYHAELDGDELKNAAFNSAQRRHDRFFTAFQDSLKNDPPFFERLLHTYFSGETDGQG